jgi:hypothetical protein
VDRFWNGAKSPRHLLTADQFPQVGLWEGLKRFRGGIGEMSQRLFHCSRFCNCQSTQKPQGSTGIGMHAVNSSIKSTYIHSISTGFNKSFDLFWEQRVGGSNPSAPTNIFNHLQTQSAVDCRAMIRNYMSKVSLEMETFFLLR